MPCYKQHFLWNSNYYINSYHLTCGSNSFPVKEENARSADNAGNADNTNATNNT